LVGLARAAEGREHGQEEATQRADELLMQGLFATITNVNFDEARIRELTAFVRKEKEKLGDAEDLAPDELWSGDPDQVSLRSTLLLGMRGIAAYAWHAYV